MSLSQADNGTHLLAVYIAMITEDIQIEVIANKISWITLYPLENDLLFSNTFRELVASTNVNNVQRSLWQGF